MPLTVKKEEKGERSRNLGEGTRQREGKEESSDGWEQGAGIAPNPDLTFCVFTCDIQFLNRFK